MDKLMYFKCTSYCIKPCLIFGLGNNTFWSNLGMIFCPEHWSRSQSAFMIEMCIVLHPYPQQINSKLTF